MISFFSKLFNSQDTHDDVDEAKLESINSRINKQLSNTKAPTLSYPDGFDKNRPTIVILDDSAGATLLFDDTIREIQMKRKECFESVQFVKISTPQAVFILENEMSHGNLNNIVGAVLDITIGGYAIVDGKTVILDGIDAFKMIKDRHPGAVMRFFTSHSMNEQNAEIYRFMQKYLDLTGKNIQDITYMKNPFSTSRMDMMIDILGEVCDV